MHKQFGYVRVSSRDQNEERQLVSMREQGVSDENIFIDKQSGENFDRPKYKQLISVLREGDVLYVHSIDRLGRNYEEIIEQWTFITGKLGADIVVMDMPLLDTRQRTDDLTGLFISNIVLQILSYVAQKERENIRQRQAEGIAAARAQGIRFGREKMDIPDEFYDVAAKFQIKFYTGAQAAKILGISRTQFYKWLQEKGMTERSKGLFDEDW